MLLRLVEFFFRNPTSHYISRTFGPFQAYRSHTQSFSSLFRHVVWGDHLTAVGIPDLRIGSRGLVVLSGSRGHSTSLGVVAVGRPEILHA